MLSMLLVHVHTIWLPLFSKINADSGVILHNGLEFSVCNSATIEDVVSFIYHVWCCKVDIILTQVCNSSFIAPRMVRKPNHATLAQHDMVQCIVWFGFVHPCTQIYMKPHHAMSCNTSSVIRVNTMVWQNVRGTSYIHT